MRGRQMPVRGSMSRTGTLYHPTVLTTIPDIRVQTRTASRMVVRQRPVQPAMAATQCREVPMAATRIRQCLAAIHSREWLQLTVPTRLLQMADSIRPLQTEPVSHRVATRRRAVIPECQITEVCRAVSQLTAFKMCRNRWLPNCPINSQGTLC